MNQKNITIALTVLVVGLLVMVFMQKGGFVSQATEHYTTQTDRTFKASTKLIETVSGSVEISNKLWGLATEGIQTAKTNADMVKLESKYYPLVKGTMSLSTKTRRFEANSNFYIVSHFAKVEEDKKTQIKALSGLTSIDVSALLGQAPSAADEEVEEDIEE